MKLKLAFDNRISELPILYGFQNLPVLKDRVELIQLNSHDACQRLLKSEIDFAFISPEDYAHHSSEFQIIPEIVIASQGVSKLALLAFQENLTSLNQIGIDKDDDTYRILAEMVLNEFYEIEINWMEEPSDKSVDKILSDYPAYLLQNQRALSYAAINDKYIDLTEEWSVNTNHDFIHKIFVFRRDKSYDNFNEWLMRSFELGLRNMKKIAVELETETLNWANIVDLWQDNLYFRPNDNTWLSLKFYHQHMFYYGKINEIPELHFSQ
jgi:predicted solute-binding protein